MPFVGYGFQAEFENRLSFDNQRYTRKWKKNKNRLFKKKRTDYGVFANSIVPKTLLCVWLVVETLKRTRVGIPLHIRRFVFSLDDWRIFSRSNWQRINFKKRSWFSPGRWPIRVCVFCSLVVVVVTRQDGFARLPAVLYDVKTASPNNNNYSSLPFRTICARYVRP